MLHIASTSLTAFWPIVRYRGSGHRTSRSSMQLQWLTISYYGYHDVDWLYGQPGVDSGQGFTKAQGMYRGSARIMADVSALLNVIEVILNVEYLYLRHTSPRSDRKTGKGAIRYHGHAPLVGFASALMTLSKTALYWLQGKLLAVRLVPR
jgi:uroporphyrin-III C-methyltransferase